MPANTYGRQVVVPLTNKSGGGVIAGDVVVVDTTNNDAFTTSTAGAFTGLIGIAQETIASNATGRVLTAGYAALVNTSASVTRGNFGKTHTVAKQAVDAGASRVTGAFCQFLTGGTTPDAHLFGVADRSGGGGGSTPTILLNYNLGSDITALSLTANTWVDIITNQSFTVASGSSLVAISVRGSGFVNTASSGGSRAVIDSAGTPVNVQLGADDASTNGRGNVFAGVDTVYLTGLAASSHTIKVQVQTPGSGLSFYCRASSAPATEFLAIQVIEHL